MRPISSVLRLLPIVMVTTALNAVAQSPVDQTVATAASGAVQIMNMSGEVRVIGWDRPEIRISGRAGSAVQRIAVEGGQTNTRIRVVIPEAPRDACRSDGCSADLEIRLPVAKNVRVETTSADIEIQEMRGTASAESISGNIRVTGSPREIESSSVSGALDLQATTGSIRVSTTSGNVRVMGTVSGEVAAESVSGNLDLQAGTNELVANTMSGAVNVSGLTRRASVATVSGELNVRGSRLQYVSAESVSGRIRFDGDLVSGAAVRLGSHSGNIELALPSDVSADFRVNTFSGGITNEFGTQAVASSRYVPSKELRFTTGNGGVIEVETFSGSVRLRRR